jgi:effector-binding domain-containing protein
MSRLSVKALRIYDEMGLLSPAWVDPASGYRYYKLSQANRAETIRILRSVDMPLDEIKLLLEKKEEHLTSKLLAGHRDRLAERLASHERMLSYLESLIEGSGAVMPYDVTVKQVEPLVVAALTVQVSHRTVASEIGAGFGALVDFTDGRGIGRKGPPFIVFHDIIDEDNPGEIELCLPVNAGFEGEGRVYERVVGGGPVATTVHRGPYDLIAPAYHTLAGWIQEHGHEVTGPPREIYLSDPVEVSELEQITEVLWPIDGEPG